MKKNDDILRELKLIQKIMILSNASIIEEEIAKIANTDTRKKMWLFIDGIRMPAEIAEKAEVTPMAVSYFLNAASTAGLIEYIPREPPKRILDYVPPEWLELLAGIEEKVEKKVEKPSKKLNEYTKEGA